MAKHSSENGADLFAIPFALARRRQKMVSEPYIVVDLDQHVRQTRRAHMTTEPAFQTVKFFVCFLAGLLRVIERKAPSVLVHTVIAVVRRGLEKEVVGPVQPRLQIARRLVGIGRQPGALKEGLPSERPLFLRKEIVVKPAKTLAVADRYVAGFQLLLELEHQCAFPRSSTGQATVNDDRGQALRDKINRRIVWKHHLLVAMLLDVHFPQHLDCLQAWRGRLSGIREEFKSA